LLQHLGINKSFSPKYAWKKQLENDFQYLVSQTVTVERKDFGVVFVVDSPFNFKPVQEELFIQISSFMMKVQRATFDQVLETFLIANDI
jgi:hypothetical protein